MMHDSYQKALAFILEGQTEKEFYLELLSYICKVNGYTIMNSHDEVTGEIIWLISNYDSKILVKLNVVGTISSITNSASWFKTQCVKKFKTTWSVFLCYDTDNYNNEITKFHEGDWKQLRKKLKKSGAFEIVDIAASADIEDIMLTDINGICKFLGVDEQSLPGSSKGKRKMKKLFNSLGFTYHEGKRANSLIKALNMEFIIEHTNVPLFEIEKRISFN